MTCGFHPEHLYYTPEFERASHIVGLITNVYFATHIMIDLVGKSERALAELESASLGDMLTASILVDQWNDRQVPADAAKTIICVPDDRLIAAVFAFIHYRVDSPDRDALILLSRGADGTRFLGAFRRDVTEEADDIMQLVAA